MIKKVIYVLLLIALFLFPIIGREKIFLQSILFLSEIDEKLDRQLIKRLRLQLYEKQTFSGGNEKYLLKDTQGNIWLFKTYKDYLGVEKDIKFSKLAGICGVRTSTCAEAALPVNDKLIYGSLQKAIPDLEEIPGHLSSSQAQQFLNAHIFKWLSGGDEIELFLHSGQVFLLDIGEALEEGSNDMKTIFEDVFMPFIENKNISNKTHSEALVFINFIQSIKDEFYCDIFKSIFELNPEQKTLFLYRKNNLLTDYKKFYSENVSDEFLRGNKGIPVRFYLNIIKSLQKSIKEKRALLRNIPPRTKPQRTIDIITSKRCRDMVFGVNSLNSSLFFNDDIARRDSDVKTLIGMFKRLRKKEKSMYEKLGISIFITQFRSDIPGFVPPLKRFSFHPDELSQACLEANLRVSGIEYGILAKNRQERVIQPYVESLNRTWDRDVKNPVRILRDSRDYLSLLLLGRIYETGGKFVRFNQGLQTDEALSVYKRALEQKSGSLTSYVNLFQLYLLKDDLDNAVKTLEKILVLAPQIRKKWNIDLEALGQLKSLPREQRIKKIRMMTLDKEGYYVMALFHFIKGNFSTARKYLALAEITGFDKDLIMELSEKLSLK